MTQLDMVKPESRLFERVSAFLGREAGLLDSRDWHEWLALFAPDAKYWAPAWVDDHNMTSDPARQANLIYADRTELEARIFRIEGEDSYASMPLPHTWPFGLILFSLEHVRRRANRLPPDRLRSSERQQGGTGKDYPCVACPP